MTFNQAENFVPDATDRLHHAGTEIGPKHGFNFVRVVFQARYHLSAGSARGTPSDNVRFEKSDPGTALCHCQGGGTTGETCANNDHIGWHRAARAARLHITSRLYAVLCLPRSRSAGAVGSLLRHAAGR